MHAMNDADYEMAALEEAGNLAYWMVKNGVCPHHWTGPETPGDLSGPYKCRDCGTVKPSEEELRAEGDERWNEYR